MPDYQKDTPRQAALRREIETHAIWQYPPEERLQHNREWQSLYLLVFEFKNFLQKIENRLQNTDASALTQDEEAMLDARYTRRSQLRGKLDTLTFTQAMRTAVAKFDTTSGKEFLAYFDAIYSNALHENVNKQANRDQGDIGLSSREGKLWKRVLDLCDKQGLDARRLPAPFYKQLADSLGLDEDALRRLIRNATSARRTFSLNEDGGDNGPAFDMADPGQEDLQLRLERTTEAMRVIALFAGKDIKDYPRLFSPLTCWDHSALRSRLSRQSATAPCWKSRRTCFGTTFLCAGTLISCLTLLTPRGCASCRTRPWRTPCGTAA